MHENTRIIERKAHSKILAGLKRNAAVVLLGPRQVGKTTLAKQIEKELGAVYLDLQNRFDRRILDEPLLFLESVSDRLVILDEVHKAPGIFDILRGVIDKGKREGKGRGKLLLLGSAVLDQLRQSGETLAGRATNLDLGPLTTEETGESWESSETLWLRGGLPEAYLAGSDGDSLDLRGDFIRTYLNQDMRGFGFDLLPDRLEDVWEYLAHMQGRIVNKSDIGRDLGISQPTVSRYIDVLSDMLLVRKLPPLHLNARKRLVRSPKIYIRDSGIHHALLEIESLQELMRHPVCVRSWEGFVIENLLSALDSRKRPHFYRTSAGAEIDLVIPVGHNKVWAVEIKRSSAPKLTRGFHSACGDLSPERRFVVYAGEARYPMGENVEAIPLSGMMSEIKALNRKARSG